MVADRGLRDMKMVGGARQAAGLDDPDEISQLPKVHGYPRLWLPKIMATQDYGNPPLASALHRPRGVPPASIKSCDPPICFMNLRGRLRSKKLARKSTCLLGFDQG